MHFLFHKQFLDRLQLRGIGSTPCCLCNNLERAFIVFDLLSWLAACDTFDLCLGVGCCRFLFFLAWMGTAILAGGNAVALSGGVFVEAVIEE